MESFQRVQLVIQEARQWLDKAQESYRNSNPVRGELDLHLAQAEVQRACEISRSVLSTSINRNVEPIREQSTPWLRYYTVGVAAAVSAIMFVMSLSLFLYSDGNKMRNHSLLGASFGTNSTMLYISVSEPVKSENKTVSTQEQTIVKKEKTVVVASERTIVNKKSGNNTTERLSRIAYSEPRISEDTSDDSRFYAETTSRGNQWRSVSTSHWGEERLIRNSMPSFSREISNEGGR
jgi:hypothetical protein